LSEIYPSDYYNSLLSETYIGTEDMKKTLLRKSFCSKFVGIKSGNGRYVA